MKSTFGMVAAITFAAAASAPAQSIIQNGNFANHDLTGWDNNGNAAAITYWDGSTRYNVHNPTFAFDSIDGSTTSSGWFAGLTVGGQRGIISQTFTTVVGHTYDVSFLAAGNDDRGSDHFYATIGTASIANYGAYSDIGLGSGSSTSGAVDVWKLYTYAYQAISTQTTLTFDANNFDNNYGVADISVVDATPIPEPATLALAGVGMAGWLAARRRK